MAKKNKIQTNRVYLKDGQIIGCTGYTDLIVTRNGLDYKLHSTEGGELDYYDEDTDTHHKVSFDMEGTRESNENFGKLYYIKD